MTDEDEEEFFECDCEDGLCADCDARREAHLSDPYLISVGLRLLVAAVDDEPEAVRLALEDIPDCWDCDRSVWLAVLSAISRYGTPSLGDALRHDLLEVLDYADECSSDGDVSEVNDDR